MKKIRNTFQHCNSSGSKEKNIHGPKKMQDPPKTNAHLHTRASQNPQMTLPLQFQDTVRGPHHRRAHSEVSFRIPDDLDLVSDPFENGPSGSFEDFGSEDDLLSTYMDIEKLGSKLDEYRPSDPRHDNAAAGGLGRHRYSNSVDGSSSSMLESIEAKKAMAPEKLAELWNLDPKRAKRLVLFKLHKFIMVC